MHRIKVPQSLQTAESSHYEAYRVGLKVKQEVPEPSFSSLTQLSENESGAEIADEPRVCQRDTATGIRLMSCSTGREFY
jgi:hypothetical protein